MKQKKEIKAASRGVCVCVCKGEVQVPQVRFFFLQQLQQPTKK